MFFERALQRDTVRVAPLGIDDESIRTPFDQRATHLIARQHTAFDPAGVEQDRESASFPIPQLLVKFEEGQVQRLVIPVQQLDVLPHAAALHRGGKLNVKAEKIGRNGLPGRIHLLNGSDWLRFANVTLKKPLYGFGACHSEDRFRSNTGGDRKTRSENQNPVFKGVRTQHCRRIRRVAGVHGEHRLPALIGSNATPAQNPERRPVESNFDRPFAFKTGVSAAARM